MLNRRYLRIKVLQALYSWFQADNEDLVKAEKEMLGSINKVYDLYLWMLLLVIDVVDSAEKLMETKKAKNFATDEDLNPNLHFIENKAVKLLRNNVEFNRAISTKRLNWSIHSDVVRKLYRSIEASDMYKQYMLVEESGLKKDKAFIVDMYEKFISDNEFFEQIIEEKSIYWSVDLELVHLNVMKTFEKMKVVQDQNSHILLDVFRDKDDDLRFTKDLLRKSLVNNKEYSEIIEQYTKNWEVDRLAKLDIILLKLAMTELEHMPTVPVKVTMNEYIDLSKHFSTPKSKSFINGVLDKVVEDWRTAGRLNKTGRGLIE
ncbi:MAG: transcription antitermination factor NusB [Crocinitomicaceae bacterium]|nr:transcription antitermination factor NusB [Crocinitomicaceae bacterium]|tara:strand:+ start:4696 stop:5646 length:951 start_codon:yes stop_codon:yes gene_type:complete